MIPFFPKLISDKGIAVYIVCLVAISSVYSSYAMGMEFITLGVIEVGGFFYFSNTLTTKWKILPPKMFVKRLFWTALAIRVVWVIFSYFFYIAQTGQPFEWDAADAMMYHEEATWMATMDWSFLLDYLYFSRDGVSDSGYLTYLVVLYKIFGPDIILTRLTKAVLSAYTCVLAYKVSARTMGEKVGKMTGVFCMLMPNMVCYCGLHLKETEMLFLCVAFVERADYLLKSRNFSALNIAIPTLAALGLFTFRTVVGVVAIFSLCTGLMFISMRFVGVVKRVSLIAWIIAGLMTLSGGVIMTEVEEYWDARVTNEIAKRSSQEARGSLWAKYATGSVLAPMILALPFSTMIDTGQYNQNVLHGGNFVKNFLFFFVALAIISAIRNGKWKDFSLIGSFAFAYLGIISFSGFGNAERFHFPALPFVLMMATYGVSQLSPRSMKYLRYWYVVVFVMELAWAFFKLGSRGAV